MSWILSLLGDQMQTLFVGCAHSFEIWECIQTHFGKHMKAKVYQYHTELGSIKKNARLMVEYLLRIKAIVDALSSIGTAVPEHEHIQTVLEGLPEEY